MRKFLKTVLFLFALSSIAYAEDDAMAILNGCRINGVDRINFYQCHFFNKKS